MDGVVSKSHNPAPLLSPDRVQRGEVYGKSWAPLTLGAVELSKGRTKLVVRAMEIPGDRAPDIKAERLRRVK